MAERAITDEELPVIARFEVRQLRQRTALVERVLCAVQSLLPAQLSRAGWHRSKAATILRFSH
jgi:hypothetical protein